MFQLFGTVKRGGAYTNHVQSTVVHCGTFGRSAFRFGNKIKLLSRFFVLLKVDDSKFLPSNFNMSKMKNKNLQMPLI